MSGMYLYLMYVYQKYALCHSTIKNLADESDLYNTAKVARYTTYYYAIKPGYGSIDCQAEIRTG